MTKQDNVNHPQHYTKYSIEAIDIIEWMNYPTLANAFKYAWRAGDKGNPEEDIKKAKWYLKRTFNVLPVRTVEFRSGNVTDEIQKMMAKVKGEMDRHRYIALQHILLLDTLLATNINLFSLIDTRLQIEASLSSLLKDIYEREAI
nr:MAG TPA: nucelotide kinase [Caudoviricetes sp.]